MRKLLLISIALLLISTVYSQQINNFKNQVKKNLGATAPSFTFNINDGAGMFLYLPGGLFELFLPIWLFIKGFNSSAIARHHGYETIE